ncbi:MAG: hypothetical protein II973_11790 [Spirochaetaceae bacterium]|nr:hypothetical protein [Spirochaetaceae bacterium]
MTFVKKSLIMIGVPVALFFILTTIIATTFVSRFSGSQVSSLMQTHTAKCVLELENELIAPMKMTEAIAWVFKDGYFKSDADTEKVFVNMSLAYPEFSGFYGCRTNKTMFTSPNLVLPAGYDPSTRGWYKGAVQREGGMFYSDVYVDASTADLVVTFSQAVYKNGVLDGVVAFDYPLTDLLKLLSSLKTAESDKSFILSSEGKFFMHEKYTPDEDIFTIENGKYKELGEKLLSEHDGIIRGKMDGKNYRFIAMPMKTTGWYYVLGKLESEVNANTRRTSRLLAIAFFLLFSVIMTITGLIMKNMRTKETRVSEQLFAETQSLVVSSKENAATAQNQSTAVKEIVATMEDNTALSEDISQKIKDVSGVASKTSVDVAEGVSYLEENVRQLHDIALANQTTIDGIKMLGDKIENIWDIVTLINSVADQAKIIAFNAELEASSAGEAGRNFHIVATEIRRLADGIIDGTKEIKERINEIQESSDSLILASESGTEKIKAGVDNAKNLEERFGSIKNASEITAESAGDITTIIQQQAFASEQILITLRQIASGVEKFTAATGSISTASENLKSIAEDLSC